MSCCIWSHFAVCKPAGYSGLQSFVQPKRLHRVSHREHGQIAAQSLYSKFHSILHFTSNFVLQLESMKEFLLAVVQIMTSMHVKTRFNANDCAAKVAFPRLPTSGFTAKLAKNGRRMYCIWTFGRAGGHGKYLFICCTCRACLQNKMETFWFGIVL